jgi:hypothetical protein
MRDVRCERVKLERVRTLKVAQGVLLGAGKRSLRDLPVEHLQNLRVRHVAHLVVLLNDLAVLVANTIVARLHKSVAGLILEADITVNAAPALVAFACVALSQWSFVGDPSKGAASYKESTSLSTTEMVGTSTNLARYSPDRRSQEDICTARCNRCNRRIDHRCKPVEDS